MNGPLHVPELGVDVDALTAALAYAKAGWPLVPVKRGTKHPGSVVGAKWQAQSTRDPQQLVAWFAGTDHGIALHVGRAGAVVFDVDVPDQLPDALGVAFATAAPPMQTTRAGDTRRGHYLFAQPAGRIVGNGTGALGKGWGEVRGRNGVIVVAPSVHAKAGEGGQYAWQQAGRVPALPVDLAAMLPDAAGVVVDAVTDTEVGAFMDAHTGSDRPTLLRAVLGKLESQLTAGSRHDAALGATCWAAREACAGLYPAREAFGGIRSRFVAAVGAERNAAAEYDGILAYAIGQAGAVDPTLVRQGVDQRAPRQGDLSDLIAPAQAALPAAQVPANQGRERKSMSTELVELALDRYALGVSTKREPFAVPLHESGRVARLLRGGSGSLRAELAAGYYSKHGKAASQQALADALMALEGRAMESDPTALHLRSAVAQDAVWLDLGDVEGRAVRIAGTGWQVVAEAPVTFMRTALTGPLPRPERDVDLAELWGTLNVAEPARPLVLAWLLAAILTPDEPCPVLALVGEQGTAKSTTSRRLASLIDPAEPQVRRAPKDADGWAAAATGSRIVALDNLSAVPDWLSDALCRAVTGDGDVRRRLYSDGDHVVTAFWRAVIVNGIDLGATRDDLTERLVLVELSRISEAQRQPEKVLDAAWLVARPRLLGALLDLAAKVLAIREATTPQRLPRMADYAMTLASVDHVLGTNGLDRYRAQAGELAADAASSDPVLAAIVVQVDQPWTGTAADLLALLDAGDRPPKGWPATARAMTAVIRRSAPLLRRLGWSVEDLGRGGKAMVVRFELVPPMAGDRQARQATSPARQATEGGRRLPTSPVLTCDDAENGPEAGDAGDRTPHLLLDHSKREKGTPPLETCPETSPASHASPASLGECPHGVVYGEQPDPFLGGRVSCPQCRRDQGEKAAW